MARLPFFYGWVIVGAAFATSLLATSLQLALSILVVPMEEDLGWQRGDIFLSFTVRALLTALLTPIFARYIDRRHGGMLLLLAGSALVGPARLRTKSKGSSGSGELCGHDGPYNMTRGRMTGAIDRQRRTATEEEPGAFDSLPVASV